MKEYNPFTEPMVLFAVLFAVCSIVLAWSHIRNAMRHLGMKRLKYINTIDDDQIKLIPQSAATEREFRFPNHASNLDEIIAAHKPSPVDDVDRANIKNWSRLPRSVRALCIQHLYEVLSKAIDWPGVEVKWKQQKRDGLRIGSDELMFHYGTGMFIRNVLREVVPDKCLPEVIDNGHPMHNWDSFYIGCLDEMVGGL